MGKKERSLRPTRLVTAAALRRRVKLVDGATGVLVYAPGLHHRGTLRHGDPTKCGVRIDGAPPGMVTPVLVTDIEEVL